MTFPRVMRHEGLQNKTLWHNLYIFKSAEETSGLLSGFLAEQLTRDQNFQQHLGLGIYIHRGNTANLRDLIAATGLVILLKLNSKRRFFSPVTLKFDGWPQKTKGHLFYATSSFVQHFIAIGKFKLELQSGNAQSVSKSTILEPCDL